jgi:hypothetical protein
MIRPILHGALAALVVGLLSMAMTSAPLRAGTIPCLASIERSAAPIAVKAIGEPGPAPLIEIATTASANDPNAVFRRTSATAAWGLFGASLSLLAALNLLFFRHLKRAYASPRRCRRTPAHDGLSSPRDQPRS